MGFLHRVRQLAIAIAFCAVIAGKGVSLAQSPATNDAGNVATNNQMGSNSNGNKVRQLGNVPEDVGYQLQESNQRIDALFQRAPLDPLHEIWDRLNERTKTGCNLDMGVNYTAIYQWADTTVSGPKSAGDGDLDFFGRWTPFGCDRCSNQAIVFTSEWRHKYSRIAPDQLNTGTVGGTIVGFDVQDFSLIQLYWESGKYEDGFITRAGKMDPALIYDGGRFVSSNYAFFSPAFSDTLTAALPDAGLGIAGAIYPTDATYVLGGIHDANAKRSTTGFNTFFGEGELFSALELGWYPNEGKVDEGMYHITFWHSDPRRKANRRGDRGIALTAEQQIGCDGKIVPFLRYSYAHRGLNNVRQNLSLGVGVEEVFGQNFDIAGVAWSWQEPSNKTLRDQYVFETFYRFHLTPHTHLSPDIQVIIDPANAPTKDSVTVLGLRLRTLY